MIDSKLWNYFKLDALFNIKIGKSIDKNKIELTEKKENSFRYISRKETENGLEGYLEYDSSFLNKIDIPVITIGNETAKAFIQEENFFTGTKVNILTPKNQLTKNQLLFIATLMTFAFKKKYNYSYTINSTKLKSEMIKLPVDSFGNPDWLYMENFIKSLWENSIPNLKEIRKPKNIVKVDLIPIEQWKEFKYKQLFSIERGRGPRINNAELGDTPFITATESNNGLTSFVDYPAVHKGNCITVNRNGSIAQAFYQENNFCSTEDVHIFYPKHFELTKEISFFLITLIKKEKYRFGYGRKWGIERMNNSIIKLPVDSSGNPDWLYMENFIKSLPYSNKI